MGRKYTIRSQEKLYFVTITVVNWIDIFTRQEYRDIFLDSVRYCQKNKGLEVYAYVVMSNHVHMILGTAGENRLQDIIRDLKKYTSTKIIEAIKGNFSESRREWMVWMFERAGKGNSNNEHYQFWQQHNQPIELSDNAMIESKLNYIHENPVKAGIVLSAEEYFYSSAKNYADLPERLLDIILIE